MSNSLSAEKIKKSQPLGKIVSEFTQSESPFELDLKVSYSHTYLAFFSRYEWGFPFVQFNY